VLRLSAGTTDFFLQERGILNFLRMAGESCKVEIALIKPSSSCLSIMLRQELLITTLDIKLLTGRQPREQIPQIRS
jgi:hypothetical protein